MPADTRQRVALALRLANEMRRSREDAPGAPPLAVAIAALDALGVEVVDAICATHEGHPARCIARPDLCRRVLVVHVTDPREAP